MQTNILTGLIIHIMILKARSYYTLIKSLIKKMYNDMKKKKILKRILEYEKSCIFYLLLDINVTNY